MAATIAEMATAEKSEMEAEVAQNAAKQADGTETAGKAIFRKDYQAPSYVVKHMDLYVDLYDDDTKVTGKLQIEKGPGYKANDEVILHGDSLTLLSVAVEEKALNANSDEYKVTAEGNIVIPYHMTPSGTTDSFTVTTVAKFSPAKNLQLMGLYKSGKIFCTQCEAMGFRRITYSMDRPDVMSKFTVRIEADKEECPVLITNGNLLSTVDAPTNAKRHIATFDDPFPKPTYLFALVAGNLEKITGTFKTMSGKNVTLNIFGAPGDAQKLTWALKCVQMAMQWDEKVFGREYDLEIFNVVCIQDFNMGAMENKGLNIFNASYLLASEKTTTDKEYQLIASVVAHEYFHNWTGNRVTCRDWFQITLKEGLTVFREQLFSEDIYSSVVKRIEDVAILRGHQFSEDGSPLAHPIRPESYVAMDNFYTVTVYNKGAEVIRMYHTILGAEGFRKGMDLYFERYDGQAVTCDDFRMAMADANGKDLTQFERWYQQSGTPIVEVEKVEFNKEDKKVSLTLKQIIPQQPDGEGKPFMIPISIGLIGKTSKKDLLSPATKVLELIEATQTFEFDAEEEPLISLLRNFSAPVKVKFEQSDEDLAFQMMCDSDKFNRWEAGQKLASKYILKRAESCRGVVDFSDVLVEPLPADYLNAFKECVTNSFEDKAAQALLISLPDPESLMQEMKPTDPSALHFAFVSVKQEIEHKWSNELQSLYNALTKPAGYVETLEEDDMSRRRLRNVVLTYLASSHDAAAGKLAYKHYTEATVMTDKVASFKVISDIPCKERSIVTEDFYNAAAGDQLVLDKWFSIQAMSDRADILEHVSQLKNHKDFDYVRPNRFRSLYSVFSMNLSGFHASDGSGYKFVTDAILKLDVTNPLISARLSRCFKNFNKFAEPHKSLMKAELIRMKNASNLSNDLREIVYTSLGE